MNDFFDYKLRHPLPQPSPHQPLTEAECDELFELFDDDSLPDNAMSLEMADGYMTACVIGPVQVPANEWMEAIFGQPKLPICADAERQHRLLQLLLHRHRDITATLSLSREEITIDNVFAPLRGEVPADEIISPYQLDDQGNRQGNWPCKDWAEGFRRAMMQSLWDDLAYDPEGAVLLAPVMLYQQGYNRDKPDIQIDQQKNLFPLLALCVGKIQEFWSSPGADDTITPFFREAPKVGRNDPCPCGSGKKYKKCCGA